MEKGVSDAAEVAGRVVQRGQLEIDSVHGQLLLWNLARTATGAEAQHFQCCAARPSCARSPLSAAGAVPADSVRSAERALR